MNGADMTALRGAWINASRAVCFRSMRRSSAILLVGAALFGAAPGAATAPLNDPILVNTGFVCRWEPRCMRKQDSARKRALRYVSRKHVAPSKIHLCNRNASRARHRVDWIAFDHCIRNGRLQPDLRAR